MMFIAKITEVYIIYKVCSIYYLVFLISTYIWYFQYGYNLRIYNV